MCIRQCSADDVQDLQMSKIAPFLLTQLFSLTASKDGTYHLLSHTTSDENGNLHAYCETHNNDNSAFEEQNEDSNALRHRQG
jgi:hypothetical protein